MSVDSNPSLVKRSDFELGSYVKIMGYTILLGQIDNIWEMEESNSFMLSVKDKKGYKHAIWFREGTHLVQWEQLLAIVDKVEFNLS